MNKQLDEWISVNDRLPEECEDVLALNTFDGIKHSYCEVVRYEDNGDDWVWFGHDSGRWNRKAFGFWQPLPAPPEAR